jgi:hypothetical protein
MRIPPAERDASVVCVAIRELRVLEFVYDEKRRVVEPYCHGVTAKGADSLRALQVGGQGSGFGFGKMWTIGKMTDVRLTDRTFVPDDPNYNPDDSAMVRIHCRVEPAAVLRLAAAGGRSRR